MSFIQNSKEYFTRKIYETILSLNWSSLSNIGNSRTAKLTILMPVIGYLFLFNTELSKFFSTTIPNFIENDKVGLGSYLYEHNLAYLYFGLLTFGIGVALFAAFAPRQIKAFPAVQDYIANMEAIRTSNLVIARFESVAGQYLVNLSGEERSPYHYGYNNNFPNKVSTNFFRLVDACYVEYEKNNANQGIGSAHQNFRSGTGYILSDEIIETMYSGARIDELFRDEIYESVVSRSKDVFYLEHESLEYSHAWIRVIIAIFYGFGLLLLAIPTLATSMLIIGNW